MKASSSVSDEEDFASSADEDSDWWGSDDEYIAPAIVNEAPRAVNHAALGTSENHRIPTEGEKQKPVHYPLKLNETPSALF